MITISDLVDDFLNTGKQIKVIFLDIDGVLNNGQMSVFDYEERDIYGAPFSEDNIKQLKRIVKKTGAYIVVSSTWRHSATPDEKYIGLQYLQRMWEHRKLPSDVIDITPYFYVKNGPNKQLDSLVNYSQGTIPRGYEIEEWLHGLDYYDIKHFNTKKSIIANYVILDDDTDMLYNQRHNFIKTDPMFGLTKECAASAINILNSKS